MRGRSRRFTEREAREPAQDAPFAQSAHGHGEKGEGGGHGEVARRQRALEDAAEQPADRRDQADVRDEGDPLEADAQRDVALALGNQPHEPPVDHHACPPVCRPVPHAGRGVPFS